MKILVVDDSHMIRSIIVKELHNLNCDASDVMEAADGIDAIRKISSYPFDLIILDIKMPKADGFDVLKYIRQASLKTKVIMCSSVNSTDLVMQAVKMGVDDYILKPFTVEKLIDVMGQYFPPKQDR